MNTQIYDSFVAQLLLIPGVTVQEAVIGAAILALADPLRDRTLEEQAVVTAIYHKILWQWEIDREFNFELWQQKRHLENSFQMPPCPLG